MRLEGQAKAGFYPTPPEVAGLIGSCLRSRGRAVLLDPCCGEGEAMHIVRRYTGGIAHGIELEANRVELAAEGLDFVLHGDSLKAKSRGGRYSLLFLNPPYDQSDGERLELQFLWHHQRSLMPGGVLVFIVPEGYLDRYAGTLNAHYEDITLWRFPSDHYDRFKQMVVFGRKRKGAAVPTPLDHPIGELSHACSHYTLPPCDTPPELYLTGQDAGQLEAEARSYGAWEKAWDALTPVDSHSFRPLLPLRKGHIALMMASGLLNNSVIESQGRRLLVRGRVSKSTTVIEEEEASGIKIIERESLKTEVTALDLETAELIEIS